MKNLTGLFVSIVFSMIIFIDFSCSNTQKNKHANQSDLLKAYNDSFELHLNTGNYDKAIEFELKELSLSQEAQNIHNAYKCKMNLACVYDRISDSKTAIKMGEEALQYFSKSTDTLSYGSALSVLSAFYGENGNSSISKAYAFKAINLLEKHKKDLAQLGSAYNQLGFCYIDEKKYDSAILIIDFAIEYMVKANRLDQISGLLLNNGYSSLKLRNINKAEFYLQSAKKIADSLGLKHDMIGIKFRTAELEDLKGNYKLSISIMKEAMALKDSLISSENLDRISALEVKYKTKNLELENSKVALKHTNAQFLIVLLIFLLLATVFTLIALRVKHQRKIQKQKVEIENNRKALNEFTQLLTSKNQQIQEILNNFEEEKNAIPLNENSDSIGGDNKEEIDEYELVFNTKILTVEDWETFKKKFNLVYPGYLAGLRSKFLDLSPAEERLILLIKMKLTSQEISDILGIRIDSVKKSRQRLRKKINLEMEIDLDKYFINLNF